MVGNIYIIKNNINNKVYIGQTTKSINKRLIEHLSDAFKVDKETNEFTKDSKFYRAIRKYGRNNFYIELLEKCNIEELSNKEIEYIAKYDSYHNGYNSTIGGDGTTTIIMNNSDRLKIVDSYKSGKSIKKIALELKVSTSVIRNILNCMDVELRHDAPVGKMVVMYDIQYKPQRTFNSKKEAYNYILTEKECKFADFWKLLGKSCEKGTIAYNHRWQLVSDLVLESEDKIFRTKFDKEAYLNGLHAYQPEGKQYYIVDNTIEKLFCKNTKSSEVCKCKNTKSSEVFKCKMCGSVISNRTKSYLCKSCSNVIAKGKLPKPSKEQLTIDYLTMNKKQIANKYGRTMSTVCYWFNQYGM